MHDKTILECNFSNGFRTGEEEDTRTADRDDDGKNVKRISVRGRLKYYINRFRYYHYVAAEKVNKVIGIVCLAIIKLYFFFMGLDRHLTIDDDDDEDAGL